MERQWGILELSFILWVSINRGSTVQGKTLLYLVSTTVLASYPRGLDTRLRLYIICCKFFCGFSYVRSNKIGHTVAVLKFGGLAPKRYQAYKILVEFKFGGGASQRITSSQTLHVCLSGALPCILPAATIQGRCLLCSELPNVRLLFEGGVYPKKYSILPEVHCSQRLTTRL